MYFAQCSVTSTDRIAQNCATQNMLGKCLTLRRNVSSCFQRQTDVLTRHIDRVCLHQRMFFFYLQFLMQIELIP